MAQESRCDIKRLEKTKFIGYEKFFNTSRRMSQGKMIKFASKYLESALKKSGVQTQVMQEKLIKSTGFCWGLTYLWGFAQLQPTPLQQDRGDIINDSWFWDTSLLLQQEISSGQAFLPEKTHQINHFLEHMVFLHKQGLAFCDQYFDGRQETVPLENYFCNPLEYVSASGVHVTPKLEYRLCLEESLEEEDSEQRILSLLSVLLRPGRLLIIIYDVELRDGRYGKHVVGLIENPFVNDGYKYKFFNSNVGEKSCKSLQEAEQTLRATWRSIDDRDASYAMKMSFTSVYFPNSSRSEEVFVRSDVELLSSVRFLSERYNFPQNLNKPPDILFSAFLRLLILFQPAGYLRKFLEWSVKKAYFTNLCEDILSLKLSIQTGQVILGNNGGKLLFGPQGQRQCLCEDLGLAPILHSNPGQEGLIFLPCTQNNLANFASPLIIALCALHSPEVGQEVNTSLFYALTRSALGCVLLQNIFTKNPGLALLPKFIPALCARRPQGAGPEANTSALYWLTSCAEGLVLLPKIFAANPALTTLPEVISALCARRPQEAGPEANTSALYWLTSCAEGLVLLPKIFAANPALATSPEVISALCARRPQEAGPEANTSPLYWLASTQQGRLMLQGLAAKNPDFAKGIDINSLCAPRGAVLRSQNVATAGLSALFYLTVDDVGRTLLMQVLTISEQQALSQIKAAFNRPIRLKSPTGSQLSSASVLMTIGSELQKTRLQNLDLLSPGLALWAFCSALVPPYFKEGLQPQLARFQTIVVFDEDDALKKATVEEQMARFHAQRPSTAVACATQAKMYEELFSKSTRQNAGYDMAFVYAEPLQIQQRPQADLSVDRQREHRRNVLQSTNISLELSHPLDMCSITETLALLRSARIS